ncbi:MAG: 4-hydroxy-tetrahydrodipicolinate synthase [Holosporaceae bacterium]|nr:4-hydroxy-tetrahydrodipicolinate synthase [Holosporaceae bacterium]
MLNNYIVAAVTPFKNNKLDIKSFEKYMYRLIGQGGISGIVVCGSTGESLSMSIHEKVELIKTASKINDGRVKVLAGVIDPITSNCLELIKKTEEFVDGFLCICPFYIKPSQEQIYSHFKILSENTARDIVLYNNPGRVGTSIVLDTLKRLCELNNVVAIKECAADLSRFLWRSLVKNGFSFLSGNDDCACSAIAMGAHGIVSVSANIAPDLCVKMYNAFKTNNIERFELLRDTLTPLHELMFMEPSPAPVKYALSKLGLISDELRLPLSQISDALRDKIDSYMKKIGLI